MQELQAGNRIVLRCSPTLGEIAHLYMSEREHLKDSTNSTYRHVLVAHLLPRFGDSPWELVDTHAIARYKTELAKQVAPRTVNKIIGLLRSLTKFAGARGMCSDDLRKLTAMDSIREELSDIDPFTAAEVDAVLRCIRPQYRFGTQDDVPAFISRRMKEVGIPSYRQLAAASGMTVQTLLNGLSRKNDMSIINAVNLALALDVPLLELIDKAKLTKK